MKKSVLLFAFFLLHFQFVLAQSELQSFLQPSDTLNQTRLKGVVLSEGVLASGALIGLNQLWYADYPHANLHSINVT